MSTIDNILSLMKAKGKKQKDLTDYLGITKNAFTDWKSGRIKSYTKYLPQIATFLGVTVDELLGDHTVAMPSNIIPINPGDLIKLPVYGNVSAGNGVFAEDNIIDYETVESSDVVPGEEYFYLKIQGDSMYPMFMDGDYILVKKQSSVDSGSFAVALVDGSEGKVKKVVYDSNWIELQSVNPMYPPSRFEDADVLRVRILGLVKGMKRKF